MSDIVTDKLGQRFDYVDIAKGMCILAVVWGHITGGVLTMMGSPVRMPFFFMVSGMLFRSSKYPTLSEFAIVRIKRLFKPYLIYSVVTWIVWATYNYVTHKGVDSYFDPLLQTILAQGSGQFLKHNSPLWFIPCLFAVEVMYFYICKLKDYQNIICCFLLAGVSIVCEYVWSEDYLYLLPWNFDAALMALPFYSIGNMVIKHIGHKRIYDVIDHNRIASWIFVAIVSFILYLSTKVFWPISMGHSFYGNHYIFYPRALVGCAALIVLSVLVSVYKNKVLLILAKYWKWAGINSFDIMATHVPIKGFLFALIAQFLNMYDKLTFVELFFIFAVVIFIDSYLVLFINKYIKPIDITALFKKHKK